MNNAITWQQWAQQLCSYVDMQKQRIDKLEQTVNKLQADLKAMKDEKRIHIDKIEYNFDQLKVEKLDGTLTIGISPSALDQIEDFSVNGNSLNKENTGGGMAPMDMNPFTRAGNIREQGQVAGSVRVKRPYEEKLQSKAKTFKPMLLGALNSIYSLAYRAILITLNINISIHSMRITKI